VTSRRAIFSGVLAAAAAIAASEGLAALLGLRESPLVAVGQSVIRLTPGPMAEAIIGVVGHADKALAVASVVVAILLLGALVGAWWPAHRVRVLALVAGLVVLASAAVLSGAEGDASGVLACVAAGGVVVGALHLLLRQREHRPADLSRRSFLRTAALIAAAAVVVGTAGEVLASRHRRRQALERVRASLRLPARSVAAPAGADLRVEGQDPWLTGNRDFYRIDTALTPPLIDPADWSLRIHGLVDRELTLTYQDLLDRGLQDAWITICCVSNPVGGNLIGNTVWGGVPIREILAEVGVAPDADALLSTSDDGWTCGTPLDVLTDDRNALLAVTMNGEPLPIPHGFPVRQVVPGLYGYVSATKWVTDINVTTFAAATPYWAEHGWSQQAPIKTESRIDVPAVGSTLRPGRTQVAGVAWAQHKGVAAVEVRVDRGPWHETRLAAVPDIDTWRQWVWEWQATPGSHVIEARATDRTGYTQTAVQAQPVPNGASGYPSAAVTVRSS
jgi:DMSO/TMAO reductase YedYZ molybdopterin-dependent catalytic subunit